jgi:hypothetical protein
MKRYCGYEYEYEYEYEHEHEHEHEHAYEYEHEYPRRTYPRGTLVKRELELVGSYYARLLQNLQSIIVSNPVPSEYINMNINMFCLLT